MDNDALINRIYTKEAQYYRQNSKRHRKYLKKIDQKIIKRIKAAEGISTLLDAGSGDGYRAELIAKSCGINELWLCEKVHSMAKLCRTRNAEVLECDILEMPEKRAYFDAVTCSWNVLGLIPMPEKRAKALEKFYRTLKPGGLLFIDVNNSHNLAYYGVTFVILFKFLNLFRSRQTRNDVRVDIIPLYSHLFTPSEIEELILQSGFKIEKKNIIDYQTGKDETSSLRGQLFYVATKPKTF